MKTIKLILICCFGLILQSCVEEADIQIQNKITAVKIVDVRYGDNYIATELLPGETSEQLKIKDYDGEFPMREKISFKMTANNKSIYLETEQFYVLDDEDELLIVLTDDTKVNNPN